MTWEVIFINILLFPDWITRKPPGLKRFQVEIKSTPQSLMNSTTILIWSQNVWAWNWNSPKPSRLWSYHLVPSTWKGDKQPSSSRWALLQDEQGSRMAQGLGQPRQTLFRIALRLRGFMQICFFSEEVRHPLQPDGLAASSGSLSIFDRHFSLI